VPPTSQSVDRKYLVFKALQLVSCNYRTATNQICPKSANDVKIVYAKQRNGF
jgi:DNA-directed RNA polymerase subunit F